MARPARARLTGFDRLEAREVPAAAVAGPLADLNTHGADAFQPTYGPFTGATAATAGGKTYFVATGPTTPVGLFASDGTQAGTKLVKDLVGTGNLWSFVPPQLATAGDKVVFAADDGKAGIEPWVTDGTAAGTKLLTDLTPGAAGSQFGMLTSFGKRAVFTVTGATNGLAGTPALWATDGTAAGTVKLTDLTNAAAPAVPLVLGDKLYYPLGQFDVGTMTYKTDLLVTDGTPAGTKTVGTLPSGAMTYSDQWAAATADGSLVYSAYDGGGAEPWVIDKSGQAARLADLNPTVQPGLPEGANTWGSDPSQFVGLNGKVYFVANDGSHGLELWATDGTAAGTKMVVDLSPTVGSPAPYGPSGQTDPVTGLWRPTPNGSQVRNLRAAGGRLYFAADDGSGDGTQLFVSDGTAAGTVKLTGLDAPTGMNMYGTDPRVLGTAGKAVVFVATDGDRGPRLFATDGSRAGTVPLPAGGTGGGMFDLGPTPLSSTASTLYFTADDGKTGRQLWATDGTPAGTKLAAVVNPTTRGSDPRQFTSLGTLGLFVATPDDGSQAGLYSTDGTAAPTLLTTVPGIINQVVPVGGKAFAVAGNGVSGAKLLVTDGTAAGTRTLLTPTLATADPVPWGPPGNLAPGIANPTAVGGKLFFTVEATPGVVELWKSDGTAAGTVKVATVRDGQPPADAWAWNRPVRQLTAVGDKLYFAVNGGQDDDVVWVSDGTAAGTKRVKDGGANGQAPDALTALGGKLYYTATSGDAGRQLWVTDGTAAGTKQAAVINKGQQATAVPGWSAYPAARPTLAAGGKLYLPVADDDTGRQLGVYDPATATVTRLTRTGTSSGWSPTGPGPVDAQPQELTAADGKVYFTATSSTGLRQVFVTDGTAAGTRVVKELAGPAGNVSMPGGGGPDILAVVGGQAVFAGDDGKSGRELWVTDGTTAGTRLAKEFAPGAADGVPPVWAAPASAVVVNNKLVLAAFGPATGIEPWAVSLSEITTAATSPPVTPPVVPPTVPPVTPPVTPPPVVTPPVTTTPAAVVRTFAVRGTQRETFKGNLASVTLPEASGYTATADWGDGKPAAVAVTRATATGTTWTVSAERTLALAGDRQVTVTISRGGQTVLTFGVTAQVAEAKFYAVRVAQRTTAGTKFSGAVATVDDLGKGMTAADLKATIDWGDGSTTAGTFARSAAGKLEVVGDHTFAAAGSRTVTVNVSGVGSSRVQTAASPFTVDAATKPVTPPTPVPPTPTPAPVGDAKFYAIRVAQRVSAGSPFRGAVAVIDDLGKGLAATGFTATIDWGDGTTGTGTVKRTASGRLEVVGEHTFPTASKPTVTVTVKATGSSRVQTAASLFTVDAVKPKAAR